MASIIVGIAGPKVGLTGETWGYVTSLERNVSVQKEILTNEDGDIVNYAYTQKEGEVTASYIIKLSVGKPKDSLLGHTITLSDTDLGGDTIFVSDVGESKSTAPGWYSGTFTGNFVETTGFTTSAEESSSSSS